MNNTLKELNKKDWSRTSKQTDKENLKLLLSKNRRNVFFCRHKWIYWTYGIATRQHRVCEKCFKKERNVDVINEWNKWVGETF